MPLCKGPSQEEQNGANSSFIAPSADTCKCMSMVKVVTVVDNQ